MPTSDEVSTLEMLVTVLEPLSVLTDTLSGEESVTGSTVRPIPKNVLDTCKADQKDEPLVAQMKSAIIGDLANRYDSPVIFLSFNKCCFLGPRFKTNHTVDKEFIVGELETESICSSLADDGNSSMANASKTKRTRCHLIQTTYCVQKCP